MRTLNVLGLLLILAMTAAALWQILQSPGAIHELGPAALPSPSPSPGGPIEVVVEPGQTPQKIGEMLEEAGVIESALRFRVLVSLLGYDRLLQAGEYEFDGPTPALEVVYRMRQGIISPHFVTVVEGWRLEQIADALAAEGIVGREDFLAAAVAGEYDFDFLSGLAPGQPLEGYLFPATYYLRRSDTAHDIVRRMLETFDQRVPEGLRREAAEKGLTLHQVVTIASIVEREARLPEERPIIAQVFLKRLRLGIPLEADPTVQYALASDPANVERYGYWKKELTRSDLEIDSPYNTYRVAGLPPGPIANPGLDAITAVVRPADTNYLYFVARPDGSHAFAETLEEHLQNVRQYQGP